MQIQIRIVYKHEVEKAVLLCYPPKECNRVLVDYYCANEYAPLFCER